MKTKEQAIATFETAKDKALELLKRDPKRSAIVIGATAVAAAALSAEEGVAGGFGFGGSKTHEIHDLNGPGGRMVAATIKTPAGWKAQGGVNWHNPSDATDPYKVSITAQSGDGQRRVEFLPSKVWKSDTQGQPMTAEGAVRQLIVPKLRPGARVVKVDGNPAEVAKVQAAMRRNPSAQAPGTSMNVDAVIAEIESHSDTGGRMWQDGFGSTFETEVWQDDPRMNPNSRGTGLEEVQRIDW